LLPLGAEAEPKLLLPPPQQHFRERRKKIGNRPLRPPGEKQADVARGDHCGDDLINHRLMPLLMEQIGHGADKDK
jgi:hypothetical protein